VGKAFIVLGLFTAFVGLLNLPGWRSSRRASNQRNASACLKTISSAQADYRGNDRDGNGVPDFWTGDVAGLATYGLIDPGVARADLRPIVPLVPRPVPFHGYFFLALDVDESVTPPQAYRQATDATSGRVHHRDRFGFIAVPADGEGPIYFINEGNSLFQRRDGWTGPLAWPCDERLKREWSRAG
jgi:hypothetical protein